MGNAVGSTNVDFCNLDKETAYIIGLWCADGYHRTSSIGITNVDFDLVEKFKEFLSRIFPQERLRLKIYLPLDFSKQNLFPEIAPTYLFSKKAKHSAYQLYVNSRSLLRIFRAYKGNSGEYISDSLIPPYIAGRFDGDGSVSGDFYRDCRIVYGSEIEARNDLALVQSMGFEKSKIYRYKKAKTFCLYISRLETIAFLSVIHPYSIRLQKSAFVPRRDLISVEQKLDLQFIADKTPAFD